MIYKVSKDIADLIAKAGISPPICFGRLQVAGYLRKTGLDLDEYFVGLCSEDTMRQYVEHLAMQQHCGWKP